MCQLPLGTGIHEDGLEACHAAWRCVRFWFRLLFHPHPSISVCSPSSLIQSQDLMRKQGPRP